MLRTLLSTSTYTTISARRGPHFTRTALLKPSQASFRTTMSFPFKPNTEPPKDMTVFKNITAVASTSGKFRRVLWTGHNSQLVIMTIPVGGEIGEEIHTVDQHLSFLSGGADAIVNGKTERVGPGDIVIVPAGAKHNFVNKGETPLILSTVYAPAEHKANTVHESLDEGEELEESGQDEPPSWAQDLHKKE